MNMSALTCYGYIILVNQRNAGSNQSSIIEIHGTAHFFVKTICNGTTASNWRWNAISSTNTNHVVENSYLPKPIHEPDVGLLVKQPKTENFILCLLCLNTALPANHTKNVVPTKADAESSITVPARLYRAPLTITQAHKKLDVSVKYT